MRFLTLIAVLLASPVLAQDAGVVDAGTPVITMTDMVIKADVDAGVSEVADAGVPAVIPTDPTAAVGLLKTVFTSVKEGNWWMAAAALLLLVVGAMRTVLKKFHDWLPDSNVFDKPLIFLYDTKIGGWLLNWLTATAGGVGTAMAAGVTVDFSLWKSVLMVSTSGTALLELVKDIKEWWTARVEAKKKAAEEEAAKKAAAIAAPPADPPKP